MILVNRKGYIHTMIIKSKSILIGLELFMIILLIAFLPADNSYAATPLMANPQTGNVNIVPPSDQKNTSNNSSTTDKTGQGNSTEKDQTGNATEKSGGSGSSSPVYTEKQIKKYIKKLESETTIPTVLIYTDGGAEVVSRTEYVSCSVYTANSIKEYKIFGDRAGIRVRGNSTAYGGNVAMIRANQVPYKIKFETKTNMFGLNDEAKCKKWVLIKAEASLLPNDIAFRLGRTILHDYNYCSDGILCHVYLNGKFKGIYELSEQNEVNKHRVKISKPKDGYTGTDIGYLVEIDNYGEAPCFRVNYENAKVKDLEGTEKSIKGAYYSIKSDVYSEEQKKFIKNYVTNVFKILYEACENKKYYVFDENYNLVKAGKKLLKQKDGNGEQMDPAEIVIDRILNLESVVDMYFIHEITKSVDVGEGSFYMYADFSEESLDERLTFTCPWDFEWAYGGSSSGLYAALFNTEAFASVYEERSNPWYIILMKQDWFVEKVKARWQELRTVSKTEKIDPISKCMKQEKELLEKYEADLSKNGKNAITRAKNLITWVNSRIKFLDGWLLDD
jgi:hypothetical protein